MTASCQDADWANLHIDHLRASQGCEDSWLDVESFPSIVWSVSELFTQRNLLEPIYWIQHELITYFYFLFLLSLLNNLTKYEL